jgi:hypothetical protein
LIENQEKRGQNNLLQSEVLPKNCNSCNRKQLEKMGIVFREDADDLFVYATLPNGWKKQSTDHSMWSDLIDDKGRKRASIFYKAAIYDRDAHISLNRRYSYRTEPVNGYENNDYREDFWHGVVKDEETIIWKTNAIPPQPKNDRDARVDWRNSEDELIKKCRDYLNNMYPEWEDYLAYWD